MATKDKCMSWTRWYNLRYYGKGTNMKLSFIQPNKDLLDWLLEGDPAIVYQVHRDLLDEKDSQKLKILQDEIAHSGWGKALLDEQRDNGLWANAIYSPKWVSTHYTLQLLMRLGFPQDHPVPQKAIKLYLDRSFYGDKGINIGVTSTLSDVCVTAMVLSMLVYFEVRDKRMVQMLDYFEDTQVSDGGWNCNYVSGEHHSSVHTTLSVLDALERFKQVQPDQEKRIQALIDGGMGFMLEHNLYKSHRTGEPMKDSFTRFSFPPRWFFDVMKALDQFQLHQVPYDSGMEDALELLCKKQKKSGRWTVQNKHAGRVYFDMEKTGTESRWNTLRAFRILKAYGEVDFDGC